ncbi:DUF2341 domain-containing protein [Fibrobacter sp.]|uniref:carboxypeptidase-like regulatory domain-containing protein n=1 Tax=Fibrobacter sp. TaxID=35828 RepID=UPI00388F1BA6
MKKLLIPFFCILFWACSEDPEVAGASTLETENAYIVKFVDSDSTPVARAVARIRPSWYVQSLESNAIKESVNEFTTDSLGQIRIDSLQSETAFLEMVNEGAGVFQEISRKKIGNGETVVLKLEKTGAISGKVELPEGEDFAWVQIYGTDRLVKTDSTGAFSLDSLPPFEYRVRAIVTEDEAAIGEDFIKVTADKESNAGTLKAPTGKDEDLSQWTYSKTIPVESLVSEWMKPIADTTVVFLRLNSDNFNFEEAMINGNDLRFTDSEGNRLESQIAAWDDSLENGIARIRLNGNASIDTIHMYWGKTAAADINSKNIWKGLSDSLYTELNSLKLIDFNSQKLESAFDYGDGHHKWYFEPQDTNVTTVPSAENVSEGFEKDDERDGYVFHWQSSSKVQNKWSMIGSRICEKPANFEGLDSITLYTKGSGLLGIALETLEEPTGKAKYEVDLDSNWTKISFTPADFVEGNEKYGNMGWDFVKPRVTTITIWIVEESEMWIDDVRLYGINRDDVN